MTDQSPLIVPLVVEAFVANDVVRTGDNLFLRAAMQYQNFLYADSAEPGPTDSDGAFIGQSAADSQYYNGVYLKWRLPAAFTTGTQDSIGGATVFPKVPNRWLVVRYSGTDISSRAVTAFIVESDYIWPSTAATGPTIAQTGSPWVGAASGSPPTPSSVSIGRNVPLAQQSWSEPGTSLGLTAMGPGNSAFAVYQPDCNNVFSFVDTLDGEPDQTLSYLVLGWFGRASEDPLAGPPADFASRLQTLGWTLASGTDPSLTASWSLLAGFIANVQWQSTAAVPGGVPADPKLSVAVGNTAIEALTALIDTQAAHGNFAVDADLLEAFQLDLIDALDAPDGPAVLAEAVHSSGFQKFSGGYRWEIVDAPGANTAVSEAELAREAQWLAALNHDQMNLDEAERRLHALQLRLHAMWWKWFSWPQDQNFAGTTLPGLSDQSQLAAELEVAPPPLASASLATLVSRQLDQVRARRRLVPTGDTPEALQAAIAAYAAARGLAASRVLKRVAAPRFYAPNNPVVLVANAGTSGIVGAGGTLLCRFPSELVTGLICNGVTVTVSELGSTIPLPDLSGVSGAPWSEALATSLIQEFFLLDPTNVSTIAGAVSGLQSEQVLQAINNGTVVGVFPTGANGYWNQNPWHPVLLCWQASYYPIAYGTPQDRSWTFQDGAYQWSGKGLETPLVSLPLGGRIQLTPAAALNMQARLQSFLSSNPDLDPTELGEFRALLDFVEITDADWDLLSQRLDAFNEQLLLHTNGVFPSPETADAPIPRLLDGVSAYPPALDTIPTYPVPDTYFQPWRCGQFVLINLAIVDEWGQALRPIDTTNYAQFPVSRPADLTPAIPILTGSPDSLVQLPPALLQPARLSFDLVSARDDSLVLGIDADVDPICGWVLPNHLDGALMAYDGGGRPLGEMSVGVDASGATEIFWVPAPGSPYQTLDEIAGDLPHFGPFLQRLSNQGPQRLQNFLRAIDETLWTVEPVDAVFDQSLAVLVGRPLAMARARLAFELDGMPYLDPSWQYTFAPQSPAVVDYPFAIELGSAALDDGLIGYFLEDQYGELNVVPQSGAAADGYLQPIGAAGNYLYQPFNNRTVTHVSLLIDPRAPVHATTAVLPAKTLALPPNRVKSALAAMNVTFRVDGILTDRIVEPGTAAEPPRTTVLLPTPSVTSGRWSWVENTGGGWSSYGTATNDTTARLSAMLPVLRRGLLQLSSAFAARERQR